MMYNYAEFSNYCKNDIMYTQQFYRRLHLAMDNPESNQHWRYQLIVNRYVMAFISCMVMLLCAEVGGHWYSAGVFPLALVFGYTAYLIVFILSWSIGNFADCLSEYFKGY